MDQITEKVNYKKIAESLELEISNLELERA